MRRVRSKTKFKIILKVSSKIAITTNGINHPLK
jgi:hypothetical protein